MKQLIAIMVMVSLLVSQYPSYSYALDQYIDSPYYSEISENMIREMQNNHQGFMLLIYKKDDHNSIMAQPIIKKYIDTYKLKLYGIEAGAIKDEVFLSLTIESLLSHGYQYPYLQLYNQNGPTSAYADLYTESMIDNALFSEYATEALGRTIEKPNISIENTTIQLDSKKSISDIKNMWEVYKPRFTGEPFEIKPIVSKPYAPGKLKEAYIDDAVNMTSFVRYLADLPYDVIKTDGLTEMAQHGAMLVAAANKLAHWVPKPDGMSETLYSLGCAGTGSSNLGKNHPSLTESLLGYMSDSDKENIPGVGHRRWVLNPPLKRTSFGYAIAEDGSPYYSMEIKDTSRETVPAYTAVTWPGVGYHPVELFNANDAWSVSLNRSVFDEGRTDAITVKVKSNKGEFSFVDRDRDTSGNYFNVEKAPMYDFAVIFKPVLSYAAGDTFDVEISGLYLIGGNSPVTLTYSVSFFELGLKQRPTGQHDIVKTIFEQHDSINHQVTTTYRAYTNLFYQDKYTEYDLYSYEPHQYVNGVCTVCGYLQSDGNQKGTQTLIKPSILSDIDTHWGRAHIEKLVELGGISGYPDGTYKPNNTISFAEFLKVVISITTGSNYSKTPGSSHWASGYYDSAISRGFILAGEFPDSNAFLDGKIHREDMALIISRISHGLMNEPVVDTSQTKDKISDYELISPDRAYDVMQAFQKGLLAGKPSGFDPKGYMTRAEAATVVIRLIDLAERIQQ